MNNENNIISAGNILVIDYGMYNHVGVADGLGFVYENSRDRQGRGKVSLEEFSDGKDIKNIGELGSLTSSEIISRAETLIQDDKAYQLLSNNCEHFIREVCAVDVKSPQIRAKFMSASFLALAHYSKNPIVQGAALGGSIATAFTKDEKNLAKNTTIFSIIGAFLGWFSKK